MRGRRWKPRLSVSVPSSTRHTSGFIWETLTHTLAVYRAAHPLVLQHREAGDDRHGSEGDHVDTGQPLEGESTERVVAGAIQARGTGRLAEGKRVCCEQEEGGDFDGAGAQQGGRVSDLITR